MGAGGEQSQGHGLNLQISIPHWSGKWVVPMSEFKDGVVGAKSKNLASLRGKLPDWIRLPPAVTVPFSSFEQVWRSEDSTSPLFRSVLTQLGLVIHHICWLCTSVGGGSATWLSPQSSNVNGVGTASQQTCVLVTGVLT
jgi:hypothetical protein